MTKRLSALFMAISLFAIFSSLQAAPVNVERAERVARNFWNAHHDKDVPELTRQMSLVPLRWDAFYLFCSNEATGFVIVAADDCVQPVLAYSFHNPAMRDSVGPETAWWLDGWQNQIDQCRAANLVPSDVTLSLWDNLYNGTVIPHPLAAVSPMITTKWDQDEPYNDSCPSRSQWGWHSRAATGCVATAMAQVMKYWNYPEHGTGTHTYYSESLSNWSQPFGTQTVNFGATTYDWDNMPDVLNSNSTPEQKAAVATLMYHCGVACDMMYGTAYDGGSGAYIHNIPLLVYGHTLNGMVDYFGYSSSATGVNRDKYDDSVWTAMVRNEIDARRPVIYAGGDETSGGHCFVCDGYDDQNRFSFNWGWSGVGDGYYTLDNLAPGTGGTGGGTGTYNFTNNQQILLGIMPHGENDAFNFIHSFPYSQDFETAPTGWKCTSTSNYTYSWMTYDTIGVDGNYSACVFAPQAGTSVDILTSPFIATPGNYSLQWQIKALHPQYAEYFQVNIASDTLFADSVSDTSWRTHIINFSVTQGDTVCVAFQYNGSRANKGLILDNILIRDRQSQGIINTTNATVARIAPNPASVAFNILSPIPVNQAEIFDISGKSVISLSHPSASINVGSLLPGLYFVRITTASGVENHKLVVK